MSVSVSVSVSVSDEKLIYKKIRGAVQTTPVSVSVSESVPSDSRPFRFDRSLDREKLIRTPDSVRFGTGNLGAVSIRKTVLPGMAIPVLKIRRPNGRLIFNMEIAIRR